MKEDCIFCKIANGIIPSYTLYEDDDFRVIFDLGPVSKGHALILPKEHYANIYELDEEIASKVFVLAKKMATAMTEAFGCDGFNILQNNNEAGGQTVFHFHMHLVPRYEGDGAIKFGKAGEAVEEKLKELEEKVKEVLNSK
ncbi:MAG: HIT family protein [Lachnospiraceae bacterium]|nr:HIT family protein [Lachnospiraceae bacterium]